MNLKTVTIADLKPHPQNPNTHPAKQIDALAESLTKFTQVKNVVIWNDRIIAGHGVIEAAKKAGILTLEAQDISHWPEDKATEFMLADVRTPGMAIVDDQALVEALRAIDEPLNIPGFDEDFLAGLPGFEPEPPPEPAAPPIDKAAELQEKWGANDGDIWQIESKANPGRYHRLICGDCRDMATVERLTEGRKVNGVFTSPPYAMQRAKQYGGVPTGEYVEWWEAVQENMRAVLAEDGSFFVNIKPHCEDGQRVLYVFDLVLAMVRRWGWRFVDELCWNNGGYPGKFAPRLKNGFEPIYHFSRWDIKHRLDNVKFEMTEANKRKTIKNQETYGPGRHYSPTGSNTNRNDFTFDTKTALPSNVLVVPADRGFLRDEITATIHAATFPVRLPAFFIKAYSDPTDTWLDPFAGSGTTAVAAETEDRLGLMIEQLPKYCAVILERFQTHTGIDPELIK